MERLAQLLWDPIGPVLYLLVGVSFAALFGGLAWRRTLEVFSATWRRGSSSTQSHVISHRDGFVAALAASVGVGNLAGVATAIHLGGPGALFWIWVSAAVGMHFRMASTYFAIKFRPSTNDDVRYATPMSYLERLLPGPWKLLATALAALLLVSGLVNANLIQSNSVAHTLTLDFGVPPVVVAVLLSAGVAAVVLGGVSSIVRVSGAIAPWMLVAYVVAGILVLGSDLPGTLNGLRQVFFYAFHPYSVAGGVAGYVTLKSIQFGVSRGVFSHGSGMGMAPFFQGANSDHPARGAYMAAMVPVFDTMIVCTITGLVILTQGGWLASTGAHLTVSSFERVLGQPGKIVVLASLLTFAFTTVTSWAHFSERCFEYLGGNNRLTFRLVFCAVAFVGPFFPVGLVWSLADVLVAVILVVHLLPLSYLAVRYGRVVVRDLHGHLS